MSDRVTIDDNVVERDKMRKLRKEKRDLKYELYQLRQRVDKLEETTEKDRKVISMLLQISNDLLEYIKVTATHVKQLENKEREEK